MSAYYNENDPEKAAWLRELIRRDLIAPGDVDERSILDVFPADLRGYAQCHFFAGIGVWSYALRLAGWDDGRPCWTGSCPCQPFSAAGKGRGTADERHLWPYLYHLARCCRPEILLGEQVASPAGLGWWDVVSADLEAESYTPWAVDFSSAGVGAPIIRQRLYWMACAADERRGRRAPDADGKFRDGSEAGRNKDTGDAAGGGAVRGLGCASGEGLPLRERQIIFGQRGRGATQQSGGSPHWADATAGHWRDSDWLFCRDGKWRPVESGSFPLAHGASARVGRLRGYGDAINAQAAKAFIEVVMEATDDMR